MLVVRFYPYPIRSCMRARMRGRFRTLRLGMSTLFLQVYLNILFLNSFVLPHNSFLIINVFLCSEVTNRPILSPEPPASMHCTRTRLRLRARVGARHRQYAIILEECNALCHALALTGGAALTICLLFFWM